MGCSASGIACCRGRGASTLVIMAAVSTAAVTMPPVHRASQLGRARCVLQNVACSQLDSSFFHPCTKRHALSELGAVHSQPDWALSGYREQNTASNTAQCCEHLIQHSRSIPWAEDLGFGVLTVANQHILTHILPNTNQNAVKGEDDQKIPFERICLIQTKKYSTGISLDPKKLEIKLH